MEAQANVDKKSPAAAKPDNLGVTNNHVLQLFGNFWDTFRPPKRSYSACNDPIYVNICDLVNDGSIFCFLRIDKVFKRV